MGVATTTDTTDTVRKVWKHSKTCTECPYKLTRLKINKEEEKSAFL